MAKRKYYALVEPSCETVRVEFELDESILEGDDGCDFRIVEKAIQDAAPFIVDFDSGYPTICRVDNDEIVFEY